MVTSERSPVSLSTTTREPMPILSPISGGAVERAPQRRLRRDGAVAAGVRDGDLGAVASVALDDHPGADADLVADIGRRRRARAPAATPARRRRRRRRSRW